MSLDTKRKGLLEDSDSDSDAGSDAGGVQLKVNQEFAQRFEHNKKREERQRLEEKYKGQLDDSESSSDDETEDDEGLLVDEDVDAQINAALQAIRNKDPRIYDKSTAFFKHDDDDDAAAKKPAPKDKSEKPVFLKDYHRERLLRGDVGADDDEDEAPLTYAQEQEVLKKSIVSEFHAAADGDAADDSDEDGDFIKRKKAAEPAAPGANGVHPSRAATIKVTELDVANADKDPELFLSNFMASRAWVPADGSNWKPFESDDEDGDGDGVEAADQWEHAYNMRFEDPSKSNEVLTTYSRNLANTRSVRREEKTGRRRQREAEKEQKEAEKQSRVDEKARLRKLKLEEAEKKLKQVKEAAGIRGKTLTDDEWIEFLEDEWDDNKWEDAMRRKFGDEYYEEDDIQEADEGEEDGKGAKRRPKKPKWDDDIDITDIVPDFEKEEGEEEFNGFDDDEQEDNGDNDDGDDDDDDDDDVRPSKKRKTTKDRKKERLAAKKDAKKSRSKLEALVDVQMGLEHHDLLSKAQALADDPSSAAATAAASASSKPQAFFRYRETSPQSFGLSTKDILLAPSDAALNQFAGIKKLAAFRDADKKMRDRKRMSKKMYLRNWRREVFGREYERSGPTYGFERLLETVEGGAAETGGERRRGGGEAKGARGVEEWDAQEAEAKRKDKKRKRSKAKGPAAAETEI